MHPVSLCSPPSPVATPQVPDCVAAQLAQALPTLSPETTCGETFEWFLIRPDQPAVAIVDGEGRVVGLVNRLRFQASYARRYYPELYSKDSIVRLANTDPVIVDCALPVAELGAMLAFEKPDALIECFVVTQNGRYYGIATGEALMRCKVDLLTAHQEQLRTALLSLTEASQAKSSFLALMSHELRTPLNAIIGFSEVLSAEIFGPLGSERYRSYAGDIHGAGKHLLALINDILDLSKAEAGRLDLHHEPLDVRELIGDCLKLVIERARNHFIDLKSHVPPDLPLLYGDELRVKQMMLNLLSNAVKFTPAGGKVDVSVEIWPSGELVIAVADTGVGIAPDMIPVALEPFRQVDGSLARKFEGTGLGLPLVKTLIERHEGRLVIESELNVGTVVRLRLPAARLHPRQEIRLNLSPLRETAV